MKKFLTRIVLFLIPLALVYGVFGLALYRSGEWVTEKQVMAHIAEGEPVLFGHAYRDNTHFFKHLGAVQKEADLLILGTSRSMQFASDFFTTDSFFNAGGAAGYPHAYRFFLETLPENAMPDTMIMVFDQYFFEEGWSHVASWPNLIYDPNPFEPLVSLNQLMKDWAAGKLTLRQMLDPPPYTYGVSAVARGSGFHADGSYCYGRLMDHPEEGSDVEFHDSFERIHRGNRRFEWADELYQPSLDEMGRLMKLCADKGIQVVGIIPPYAPAVWERMVSTGKYGYMQQIPAAMTDIMEPYGFELYDFSYMPDTQDAEYIDGYHGGDRVYARIALRLAEKSSILSGLIDTDYLEKALAPNDNPLRLTE